MTTYELTLSCGHKLDSDEDRKVGSQVRCPACSETRGKKVRPTIKSSVAKNLDPVTVATHAAAHAALDPTPTSAMALAKRVEATLRESHLETFADVDDTDITTKASEQWKALKAWAKSILAGDGSATAESVPDVQHLIVLNARKADGKPARQRSETVKLPSHGRNLKDIIRDAVKTAEGKPVFLATIAREHSVSSGALELRWKADNNPGTKAVKVPADPSQPEGRQRKAFVAA